MPEHFTLKVHGYPVEFHIYVSTRNSWDKVRRLEAFFRRLPVEHLAVLYPIFVMERKPGGRVGGGAWPPGIVRSQVMGGGRSRNTGVPDEDVERLVVSRGKGLIGLSRDRWERAMGRLEFTVFHEVGHSIDFSLGLVPRGATAADFPGMVTNRCGSGDLLVRRAVEVYARYICGARHVYHALPALATPARTNRTLISTLRRSPAFRSVPDDWNPRA
jgi:hypothetical protein